MGAILESIRSYVLTTLYYDRNDAAVVSALETMTIPQLLITYVNWQSRFIIPRPRKVLRSPQFDTSLIRQDNRDEIALLIDEIERGCDLTRRLSKLVRVGFTLPKKRKPKPLGPKNRPDLDLLLNDWRVHHLHISSIEDKDGCILQGKFIVFALFEYNRAYLIDIYDHKSWAAQKVVETAVRAWPDDGLFLDLKLVTPGRCVGWNDDERLKLRNTGFTTSATVDGRIFIGAGGISTSGLSVRTTRRVSHILRSIAKFEEDLPDNISRMKREFLECGISFPENPVFEFSFFQDGFGVIEKISDTPIEFSMSR